MDYAWRSLRFDLPAGLDDESVLTFLARKGGAVDLNLTFTRDRLSGKLELYLADAVEQMKKQLSGYQLVDRQARKIAGKDGFVLEHSTTAKNGAALCMLQAYLPDGEELVIVTGTAAGTERARLLKAFEAVVGSLKKV
jgi:hypothetical protein